MIWEWQITQQSKHLKDIISKNYFMIISSKNIFIVLWLICISLKAQDNLRNELNLMPWPQELTKTNTKLVVDANFTISVQKKEGRVYNYATNIIRRITNKTGVFINEGFPRLNAKNTTIKVEFDKVEELGIHVDESYVLEVKEQELLIKAKTDVGAIRALETMVQLIAFDEEKFFIPGVLIKDTPRFVWRGLMIDVARHFQPVHVIKRNLRAMAALKMNVFHWHLSDDQGYRIESKIFPKLHKEASDNLYYTHSQIKDVINYANSLGIRVIPEIDVPGHATAILTAYPELGSKKNEKYELERYSGVFDPTLDPTNTEVYVFLDKLFSEVITLFPDEYFHIGGDENEGKHWNENKEISKFKKEHNLKSNHELQTYFNIKLQKILSKYNKKLMGWDEIMTKDMLKTAIIHSWRGANEGFEKGTLVKAVKKGYNVVLSNDYYIDRLQSVNYHYMIDPVGNKKLTKKEEQRVLGGEVTMWSELVTPLTIDSRIWPRTAAIAERFWSSKKVNNIANMRKRLVVVNDNLELVGITNKGSVEVILRNITKTNTIEPLKVLTGIYEPLKVYTRNKEGTEYKTFSPFILFADACTADAADAYTFNTLVSDFIKTPNEAKKSEIIKYFIKWEKGYTDFLKLPNNPILKKYKKHYKSLHKTALFCIEILQSSELSEKDRKELKEQIEFLKTPLEDTELMVIKSIEKLYNYSLLTLHKSINNEE
ncbi:family 20 glycosylhydrolase [Tenacibaculum sp. 1_MG-2023]|uniref:family 20 glycosylhydrolase n=1 Tax=Tenacibaculum sp. 1_MG-2023 TaxID=3062653 RepID=UPI0026E1EE7C|nr:family 20 glycosylhydrolase [Tenacibaculum sp. 1_MG-2023]MDO6676100.1 family 20 glycosylhydrolase [Tenacibaculum sp. 1_MG-2023]